MPNLPAFMKTNTSSVPAGSGQMQGDDFQHDIPRTSPYTASSVTPYLGLRSRLSQIWFNRWTILIILILARMLLACASVNTELTSSRTQALSACSSVESMGSVMASMPHYMSQGVNEMTASGIEKSVNALMQTSSLAVTGVEEIVVFVINMMTSTYLCLITLAVSGSAHAVLGALDDAQSSLNSLTKALGDDMADVTGTFQKSYNDIRNKLKGGVLGIGGGIDLPSLDLTGDIDKLHNLQLPPGLSDSIKKLNASIPDFTEVKNLTDTAIRFPFEKVKVLIDASLSNYTFDRSVFPVPQKEKVSFCTGDNGIDGFFDHLSSIVDTGKKIFFAVLLLAALLVCIPMAYREIRRYRKMQDRSRMVGHPDQDAMDVVYIVSRPYTASAGIKISSVIKSPRRQILVRWVVAYATSEAALFVLALAIAGLFSCLCQYILLKSIEKEVPALTSEVAGFADKVVDKLNNASAQWAINTNKVITKTNESINHDMFGWVNTSTVALNDTLNVFVDVTSTVLNKTFGNTILYDPIKEVLNCLILLKVAGFQKGLTWIHDNAHINLPLMRNDTFSLGAAASLASDAPPDQSFLANPGDVASDKISNVVAKFVNAMVNQIKTETIISLCVLCIYLLLVLIAIIRAATLWNSQNKVRGEGGAAASVPEVHAGMSDFRSNNQDRYGQFDYNNNGHILMDTIVQQYKPSGQCHHQNTGTDTATITSAVYNDTSRAPPHHIDNYAATTRSSHENGPAPRYSAAIEEKTLHQSSSSSFQRHTDHPFSSQSQRSYSPSDFGAADVKR